MLFHRKLDPRRRAADRGLVPFGFAFDAADDCDLLVRTAPGTKPGAPCSSVFWTAIQVE